MPPALIEEHPAHDRGIGFQVLDHGLQKKSLRRSFVGLIFQFLFLMILRYHDTKCVMLLMLLMLLFCDATSKPENRTTPSFERLQYIQNQAEHLEEKLVCTTYRSGGCATGFPHAHKLSSPTCSSCQKALWLGSLRTISSKLSGGSCRCRSWCSDRWKAVSTGQCFNCHHGTHGCLNLKSVGSKAVSNWRCKPRNNK